MQRPPTVRLDSGACSDPNNSSYEACQCYNNIDSIEYQCLNGSYCENQCKDPDEDDKNVGGCTAEGKCKSKLDQSCSTECNTDPYFMGPYVPKGVKGNGVGGYIGGGDCTACNVLYEEKTGTCSGVENVTYESCQGDYTPKYCYPKGQPCDIDKNISCCNSECNYYHYENYEKTESFCG